MNTVDPFSSSVHYDQVSVSVAAGPAPNDLLSAIAIAVVIMLMVFALQSLKGIIGDFFAMIRLASVAVRAALLVFAALAGTLFVLIVQLRH